MAWVAHEGFDRRSAFRLMALAEALKATGKALGGSFCAVLYNSILYMVPKRGSAGSNARTSVLLTCMKNSTRNNVCISD